jgi:hypothetical protein
MHHRGMPLDPNGAGGGFQTQHLVNVGESLHHVFTLSPEGCRAQHDKLDKDFGRGVLVDLDGIRAANWRVYASHLSRMPGPI